MRASIGLALLLCAMPLAWILRFVTGGTGSIMFAGGLVIISILCITNFSAVLSGRVLGTSASWVGPIVALASMATLGLVSIYAHLGFTSDNSARDPFYFASYIALILAVHTAGVQEFDKTALACQDVCLLSCTAFVIQCFLQGGAAAGQRFSAGDSSSPNQMAFVAGIGLVAAVFVLVKSGVTRSQKLRAYLCLVTGAVAFVLTATRSVLFGLIFCFVAGLWQLVRVRTLSRSTVRALRRAFLLGFVLTCTGVVVYAAGSNQATLTLYVNKFVDYLSRGYDAYVVGVVSTEYSAEVRRSLMVYAIKDMNFIGHGYRHTFLDFPFLQAFFDGGFAFGMIFLVTTFILPLYTSYKILRTWASAPAGVVFVCYLYILFLPNLFLHGQPYDYTLWFPILLFYGVCRRRARGSALSPEEKRKAMQMSPRLVSRRAYRLPGSGVTAAVKPTF